MTTKTETRNVPAAAMRFDVGPCQFGQAAEGDGSAAGVPVTIKARDGGVVDHWFWGRVVHDLAGMEVHKERLLLDYAHWDDEVIGYLDRIDTSSGDLMTSGRLIPFTETDRASEVIFRAKAGVPYEASICFDGPLRVEEVDAGVSLKVNGRDVWGPLMIFRQWSLRNVAVCPLGADRNTKTQLTAGDREVSVAIFREEGTTMGAKPENKTADPNKLSEQGQQTEGPEDGKTSPPPLPDKQAEGEQAAPDKAESPPESAGKQTDATEQDPRAECKRFIGAFGAENGAKWFADRKTFAEAQQLHSEALAKENGELKAKLANVDRGEEEALSGTPEGSRKVSAEQSANLGDGLSALVAHNAAVLGRGK